jgi:hypothetical protein
VPYCCDYGSSCAQEGCVKRLGPLQLEGNAEFFLMILLVLGATIVGTVWAIAWAVVRVFA